MNKIMLRRDLSNNWTASNPILSSGEIGLETDTKRMKVGDGLSHWNDLAYWFYDEAGAEYVIELGSGSGIRDRVTNAPPGGIPAGFTVVPGDDILVDVSFGATSQDLVIIHDSGRAVVFASVAYLQDVGGVVNIALSDKQIMTESVSYNQTVIYNFESSIESLKSFIYLKFS